MKLEDFIPVSWDLHCGQPRDLDYARALTCTMPQLDYVDFIQRNSYAAYLRYVCRKQYKEIAEELGISSTRARQVVLKTLSKMGLKDELALGHWG